jgi:DNA (cytosine-5)-methyltransferase 1
MVRVAIEAKAHTIVAENVPHLLRLEGGENFDLVIAALVRAGYPFVAWRLLNARSFGLPHDRKRIFIVATKHREVAVGLHRPLEASSSFPQAASHPVVAGFYWTAGVQSLCYSPGFVPTLKVGSTLSIPSPPALHFEHTARLVRPGECLRLQGFELASFAGLPARAVYRMAGNAVASPVGRFVVESLTVADAPEPTIVGFGFTGSAGLYESGTKQVVGEPRVPLCDDLHRFVDLEDRANLSPRAAAGLLRRLARSEKACPPNLREDLERIASGAAGRFDADEVDYAPAEDAEEDAEDGLLAPRGDQLGFFDRS